MNAPKIERRGFLVKVAGVSALVGGATAELWLARTKADAAGTGVEAGDGDGLIPGPEGAGLGPGASLGGRRPFPDDHPWNVDVSRMAVDPNSDALIHGIGLD